MASSFEQQIRVTADTSPAEKAVGKLTTGLGKVEKLAKGALDGINKPARLNISTSAAQRQLEKLQSGVAGLSQRARLDFDTRSAEQQLTRIKRDIAGLSQRIRLNLETSLTERKTTERTRGDSAAAASAPALIAIGGSAGALSNQVKKTSDSLGESYDQAKKLQAAYIDLAGEDKRYTNLVDRNTKALQNRDKKLDDITAASRRLRQNLYGFADSGKSMAASIRDNSNALEAGGNWLGKYQVELQKTTAGLYRFGAAQRKAAAEQADLLLESPRLVNGLSFDERLANRRKQTQFRGTGGKAAAAGAASAGLFIPGLSEIATGGAAGFAVGGAPGAAIGAAAAGITAATAAAVKGSAAIAEWSAELEKSRIALRGVSGGSAAYEASLAGIARISTRLNVPIGEATAQFTSLRAAMAATGFTAADSLRVYENLAVANKALGGNSEKLQGILLATSQVFSKGKVTAEELRGQIGERLPGAVAEFAAATGRTTAQLDEALTKGEVSLSEFVKFTEQLAKKYGATADKIAKSSEDAGARLKTSWDGFKQALGPILTAAGAAIQKFAADAIKAITPLLEQLARFLQLGNKGKNDRLFEVNSTITRNQKLMADLTGRTDQAAQERLKVLRRQTLQLKSEADELRKILYPKTAPTPAGTTGTDTGADTSKDDKEKLEDLYNYANQNAAALAQNELALNKQVFDNEMALLKQRYEAERTYIEKLSGLRGAGLSPGGRDTFGQISQYNASQRTYQEQRRELEQAVLGAKKDLEAAKAGIRIEQLRSSNPVVGTTASGGGTSSGSYIQGGYGPSGANAYGPHFDIKRSNGSYFRRNELDNYVVVNGKPLSSGVTVPGGQFGASRDGGTRTHNAWDYAFGGRAELQLQNGAKWLGSTAGNYGDNAVFQTPDGQIYRIIHGKFDAGSGGTRQQQIAAGGQANLTGALGAQGDVTTAQAALDGANQRLTEFNTSIQKLQQLDFPTLLAGISQGWKDQTIALQEQTAQLQLRTRLELEGVDPALIEGEAAKLQISQQLQQQIEGLNAALALYTETQGKAGISAQQHANALAALSQNAASAATAVTANAQTQKAANDLAQAKSDAQGIASGVTSGIKEAITAALTGGDVRAAFANALAGLGDRFLDIAMRPLEDMLTNQLTQLFSPQTLATNANSAATVANTAAVSYLTGVIQAQAFSGGASVGGFDWGGIASSVLGAFSGGFGVAGAGFGGGAFGAGFNPLSTGKLFSGGIFEGGGYTGDAPRAGGLDGKGGFPALLHPNETVVDHRASGARAALKGGEGGAAPTINIQTGNVVQFEGANYVSMADFEAGLAKAANQGAERGHRKTLDKLRQSPGTRRSLGM